MNSLIESLNQWGENFLVFAWPMLWQSSLLIAGLFAFDFLLRRKLRASIRYALWLVVLVKLCVSPTLAFPTSPAWWWHVTPLPVVAKPAPHYTVTYADAPMPELPLVTLPAFAPPAPMLTKAAWLLAGSVTISALLFSWMLVRWWQVARLVRRATAAEQFSGQLADALRLIGAPEAGVPSVRLKIVAGRISPAVCGLLRPTILLPLTLAENFSGEQLRAVLLHELIHLRRWDVWVNCLQALLQIFYWWHPLLWMANARIRRVREEAVDDAVMLALRDEAESYAPTLLEVAKLALNRPLVSLGLVGIMESRHALRQRIERLVDFRAPRHAGLTLVSLLGILAFTAVAVPMGDQPATVEKETKSAALNTNASPTAVSEMLTNSNFRTVLRALEQRSTFEPLSEPEAVTSNVLHPQMRVVNLVENAIAVPAAPPKPASINTNVPQILVTTRFYLAASAMKSSQNTSTAISTLLVQPAELTRLQTSLDLDGYRKFSAPRVLTISGERADMYVGNGTNSTSFSCQPTVTNGLIQLLLEGRVVYALNGRQATNLFKSSQATVENHGAAMISVVHPRNSGLTNLIVLASVEIITNADGWRPSQPKKIGTGKSASEGSRVMAFKLDGTVREDTLRRALLVAGVKMPPTVLYYSDGGILLVRGSVEQLALVNRVLLKLDGTSPAEIEANMTGFSKRLEETKPDHGYPTNLFFTRTFKTDEWKFRASLRKTGADISDLTNSPGVVTAAVRKLFASLGVDWETPVGKSVFYNDRNGMLFVRATTGDLEVIEQAIQTFNYTPPQIHIKTRFFSVPKGVSLFPGQTHDISGGLVGILSNTNAMASLRSLEKSQRIEVIGEPEVVTTSGRQCQMRQTQVITLLTNFYVEEVFTNINGKLDGTTAIRPAVMPVETGPVFDVVPTVLADGNTLDLTMTASSVEFFGYSTIPSNMVPVTATNSAGEIINLPSVWPAVQVYRKSAHVNLYDNQTAVLVLRNPEQVKFAPPDALREEAVANWIRDGKKKKHVEGNEIIVFITATIVDPAANRVHADDELPFAQKGIPPQPQAK